MSEWRGIDFVSEHLTDAMGDEITVFDVTVSGDLKFVYRDTGLECLTVKHSRMVFIDFVPYEIVDTLNGVRVRKLSL